MLTSGSALNSSTQRNVLGHVSSNADTKPPSYGGTTTAEKGISYHSNSTRQTTIQLKLSLISPQEFTILSHDSMGIPSGDLIVIEKFRSAIEDIASAHGGAAIENPSGGDDNDELLGTTRIRIPLKCYDQVAIFLERRGDVELEGIPEAHRKLAELHFQTQGDGEYPASSELVEKGVPEHLASTLTGYQRQGVAFVLSRDGKALIADDMGLGKTIQSIASMSAYASEWPLLVLSPSSARFNWEVEFLKWLGKNDEETSTPRADHDALVEKDDIQVLESGKEKIRRDAKVVICSYGLLATLITKKRIKTDTFNCIIVDESHMLKNMKAKRTEASLPILKAAKRTILLSGTPAFKNPQELYPQLSVLSDYWSDYQAYKEQYCYKSSTSVGGNNLLTLHALVSSTVMIRRRKADVLADALPEKTREISHVTVSDKVAREHLDGLMDKLRDTKGSLGEVARVLQKKNSYDTFVGNGSDDDMRYLEAALTNIAIEGEEKDFDSMISFLPKLFELTGRVKVPVVTSQLIAWLNENEGKKIIVFAHHQSVLNKIEDSIKAIKRIRIDGSTNPKKRQDYVKQFQNDPRVRVALLSTTAAGVAITLTASSCVWFAELYWTPGLLIQAEDRCHRIGQKEDVTVNYFVANDTLDDVLWKLAVRKFVAVGEMVDGSSKSIEINDHDEALLLDVSLAMESFFMDNESSLEDFIVDDDDAEDWGTAAKKGKYVDVSPSKSVEFAPLDDGSESEGSFDSANLTDDDDIEDESDDNDSDESDPDDYLY